MTLVTADRVRALLAAYGANPDRWPSAERDDARRLVALDPALAAEVADAAAFDTLLDTLPTPAPSPALRVALKDIPERARFGWTDRLAGLWPFFGAPWRPAAGLVAAAVIGIVVGVTTSDVSVADTAGLYADYDPIADAAAMASGAGFVEFLP
ncbi:hypothetical protein BAL199_26167 [alpha proteobacterium BAL199]|jgi:hypothetical protein|nr:hypothetical protein BAL199_26167 [alpha proteobacterium BAL199]